MGNIDSRNRMHFDGESMRLTSLDFDRFSNVRFGVPNSKTLEER